VVTVLYTLSQFETFLPGNQKASGYVKNWPTGLIGPIRLISLGGYPPPGGTPYAHMMALPTGRPDIHSSLGSSQLAS